jgi:ABC-type Zn2+ transport system substrate-binding protein/surface adhesin
MSDEQEQEKNYEVKDKRRVNPDGTLRETDEEQPAAETPAESEEAAAAEPEAEEHEHEHPHEHPHEHAHEDLPLPSVYDLMMYMAGMIAEQAWLHMGLRLAPGKKEPTKDLAQAKVAVDTVVFLVDKLGSHIAEEDRRALRGLVSDLQMNFVRQSQ